jgi:uncharacterized protein (DUF1697 family)
MPTHVALLRGVNVAGVKLAMADLRQLVSSLGHADVVTYIQSGNVLFATFRTDLEAIAREMEDALATAHELRTTVFVLDSGELADVVAANPYSAEPNPRFVHGVFLPAAPDPQAARAVDEAVAAAAGLGSRDQATIVGRMLYLHTPDGFGASGLVRALLLKRSSPVAAGTARNWSTVTKLLALCDG